MSKKNRERRAGDDAPEPKRSSGSTSGGGGLSLLPLVLAIVALGLGFVAWTDAKKIKDDTAKQLSDVNTKLVALQTQVANAAKARTPAQPGPDPNKVYTVKTDGSPTEGTATAPIVIAEFSDYQ
jgi:protein-disulfide isomerase